MKLIRLYFLKFLKLFFQIPYSSRFYLLIINDLVNKWRIGKDLKAKTLISDNFFLNLRLDDWLQQQIYFLGGYENFELEVLRSKISLGSNVIDIGANVGLYSLFSASIIGIDGKVFAFEPYSSNFNILTENLKINNFKNLILNKIALANKDHEVELFYNPKEFNLGMVSAYEKNYEESETVNCTTLDNYLKNLNLDNLHYIKLDIEGGEYLALLGMIETIKKYKPFIQIEIDEDILKQTAYTKNDILLFFEMNNYQLVNPEIYHIKRSKSSKNYFFKAN